MRRTNPFEDIEELFDRLSRQFDEMGHQFDRSDVLPAARTHEMAVDLSDSDDRIVLSADLPGYEKSDISLSLADRLLTIDAKRDVTEEREEGEYLRRERRQQSVRRSVRLPEAVDEAKATASYHNGVLTVTLPKAEPESDDSHRIDID